MVISKPFITLGSFLAFGPDWKMGLTHFLNVLQFDRNERVLKTKSKSSRFSTQTQKSEKKKNLDEKNHEIFSIKTSI